MPSAELLVLPQRLRPVGHGKRQVAAGNGDNRYHAIFGNRGPAKFVSASRFAPALIAWNATRPRHRADSRRAKNGCPSNRSYITPKTDQQNVTVLKPGQLITHVWLPDTSGYRSATYEVLESTGLDWPLASAAACISLRDGK